MKTGFYWVKLEDYLIHEPFPHRAVINHDGWCIAYYYGYREGYKYDWSIGQNAYQSHNFAEIGTYLGEKPDDR